MPTYNERDNVEPLVCQLQALELDADLLFVDDHSPDGTGEVLERLTRANPRLSVIHRPGKLGVGSAHLVGIGWAYERGYDALVTMDCDFTHSPADLPRLLAAAVNYDVTVASRYLEAKSLPGWNLLRRFLTNFGHFLTRRLLGMEYDATGALRVYQLRRIPRELFGMVVSMSYAFLFESLFLLHRNQFSIGQVPIVLPARTYGHSKMSFWEPWRSLKQVLALSLTAALNPAQFRLAAPVADADRSLVDPQEWDAYWGRKRGRSKLAYEVVATLYRTLVIRRRLERVLARHFPAGARLLHAGCGSGQVDVNLQRAMDLTAVDISLSALQMYRQYNPAVQHVRHASVLALPFDDGAFDGAYSLGLMEHFTAEDIHRILCELRRVLRPGGRLVIFWPHADATSVKILGAVHWLLNDVLHREVRLHPAEVSLLRSRSQAESALSAAGLTLEGYAFGPADLFVQAVIVASKRPVGGAP